MRKGKLWLQMDIDVRRRTGVAIVYKSEKQVGPDDVLPTSRG